MYYEHKKGRRKKIFTMMKLENFRILAVSALAVALFHSPKCGQIGVSGFLR